MNALHTFTLCRLHGLPAVRHHIQKRVSWVKARVKARFADDVVGNLLHEAWRADGEPLERISHQAFAKRNRSRYLIVPHNRSR